MLIVLDRLGVSASSGAACSSGSLEPSHVLLAAGYSESEAKEGLRFTLGRNATIDQAQDAANRVIEAAKTVRG
jgi:cysteine desulfurase